MIKDVKEKDENLQNVDKQGSTESSMIDLATLRLSQDFSADLGLNKVITTIAVKKPGNQDFVRVHPDENKRLETAVLEIKEDRETFLIDPKLWSQLANEIIPKILFTTINRQGALSIWPVRLPDSTGKIDNWNASALVAANLAMDKWVRVSSNRSLGAYEVFEASGIIPEPEFPDMSLEEIFEIAFKDKFISDINHQVLKKLRGEV